MIDRDTIYVGIVVEVTPQTLIAVLSMPPNDDPEVVQSPMQWALHDFGDETEHKRISKKQYMLYRLKGYNLPKDVS